jgi:hypothetical protein
VKLASRVRVLLGKNWTVMQADNSNRVNDADYVSILISEKFYDRYAGGGWKIQMVATGVGAPSAGEFWAALKLRRLPEMFALHGQKIYIVTRE